MKLSIETRDAPVGTPLRGALTGCQPGSQVNIQAVLKDMSGESWTAQASFAADAGGKIELATSPSLSGSFAGVDPHGLFWTAQPKNADTRLADILLRRVAGGLAPKLDMLSPLEFDLTATEVSTGEIVTDVLVRRRLPSGVEQSRLPAPLCGLLFEPKHPNGAGIVLLGGSEGGVFPGRAALLAASGFTAIALAYFDYPGRPQGALNLPLSYFRDALTWLRDRSDVQRAGLLGVSRGSEAAQLTAINWPDLVDALVLWVPTHLRHGEINLSGGQDFMEPRGAMWSLSGRPIPGIEFTKEDRSKNKALMGDFLTAGGRRYREIYERAWAQTAAQDYRIPIEQYPGPTLAVGGADDALWPSDIGATRIIEAARKSNKTAELLVCPSAGHLIGTPGEPRPFPYVMHWTEGYMGVENGFCAYGGTPEGAATAALQSWATKLNFLQTHLC
ncbi:MAG: acyl-CoA thioesterase/bile acid-CoA:amino acid N-acyltransferase family protein [Pseudomonadota bacterium]